ncbi:MAG: AraC family transcriptional regulator [Verrucomicrobiae bacterium]|nr:AraC family transcriptional regulator [Verrucomicrobiae bacterium]
MPSLRPAIFIRGAERFIADTCDPLRRAAERKEVRLSAWARGHYPGRRLPNKVLTEVRSIGFWDASRTQTWGLDWHRNEGIEITYLARGKTGFAVDGRAHPLRRGDLTITRPWQLHRVGDPAVGASRLHWLILDVKVRRPHQAWQWPSWLVLSETDRRRLTQLLQHNEQPVWRTNGEIERCFERAAAVVEAAPIAASESRLKLHLNELLIALLEMLERKRIPLDETLTATRRSVEMFLENLPQHVEHPWTLEEMAEHCSLARSRFTHYCKEITNMSPIEYLTRCRVEHAARLLRAAPRRAITEVALASGFGSSQYFATVFRKQLGATPREIQRACRRSESR